MEILYSGEIFPGMEFFLFLDYHFELIKAVQWKVSHCEDICVLEEKFPYYTYIYEQSLICQHLLLEQNMTFHMKKSMLKDFS